MNMTVNIDTTGFDRAIRDIARLSGASVEKVVAAESEKVLESAIRSTPAARAGRIRASHRTRTHVRHEGKTYNLKWRVPTAVWSAIQAKRKRSLRARLAARGLAKQSWLKLAHAEGLRASAPGFVSKAVASTGKEYPGNFSAARLGRGGTFGIRFKNAQPTVQTPSVRGRRIIAKAIAGRRKFFERNLREGVFSDLKAIRFKYPGVFITTK